MTTDDYVAYIGIDGQIGNTILPSMTVPLAPGKRASFKPVLKTF